jgi:hypothetical protein
MLRKFEIVSVKRTQREYKYYDVFLSKDSVSKEKIGIEYEVFIEGNDGERYYMAHQPKTDPSLRPYKIMFVDAFKMESRDGTKYNASYEGVYKVRCTYSKEQFDKELGEQKERLMSRQQSDANELQRLAALTLA